METIDAATVRHVALLSRLSLNDEELALYSKQLASILLYISKLNEIDTKTVAPTRHVFAAYRLPWLDDAASLPAHADDSRSPLLGTTG